MPITAVTTVDVQDMLCAQAIMVVWRASRAIPVGAVLEIVCNAADVRQDLMSWAKELRYPVIGMEEGLDETRLWVQRGT